MSWIPWYIKIAAKLVLSRLPVGYSLWSKLNLFAHGAMHKPDYAYGVFRQHYERSHFSRKEGDFVALEVGPGDSLLSAIVAVAHGASRCYLIDAGAYATEDLAIYRDMVGFLRLRKLPVPDIDKVSSLAGVLESCNAVYGTQGLRSLRVIPTDSVDFIWSQAVLEHIRHHEFLDTVRELHRVLRPGGICSHRVDLKDHLGGALNNMRFASRLWESDWMAKSGFYTNRIRFGQMVDIFSRVGFKVEVTGTDCWHRLPTPRSKLSKEYREMPINDLQVSAFDVLLHK